MTYKEAYNKIIAAYFKDKIQPYDAHFCFCGTLGYTRDSSKQHSQSPAAFWDSTLFSVEEYTKMEYALLSPLRDKFAPECGIYLNSRHDVTYNVHVRIHNMRKNPDYEDVLFEGMCKALDVLKEIYIKRGENVDDVPVFIQRKITVLCT